MSHESVSDKPWTNHCSCISCHSLSTSRPRKREGQKYPEGRIHIRGNQWHWAFMQCCDRVRTVERNVSELHRTSNTILGKKSQCRKNRCLSDSKDSFRRGKFHRVHHNHWLIWEEAQQLLLRVKANQAIKIKLAGEVLEAAKGSPSLQDRAEEWQILGSAVAERVLTQVICAVGQRNRGQTCCTAKSKERNLEDDSESWYTDTRCTSGLRTKGESTVIYTVQESCLQALTWKVSEWGWELWKVVGKSSVLKVWDYASASDLAFTKHPLLSKF